jgi:hypothetical protein
MLLTNLHRNWLVDTLLRSIHRLSSVPPTKVTRALYCAFMFYCPVVHKGTTILIAKNTTSVPSMERQRQPTFNQPPTTDNDNIRPSLLLIIPVNPRMYQHRLAGTARATAQRTWGSFTIHKAWSKKTTFRPAYLHVHFKMAEAAQLPRLLLLTPMK